VDGWNFGWFEGRNTGCIDVLMEWFMAATLADSWVGQLVGVKELLRDQQMVELMVVQMDGDLDFWRRALGWRVGCLVGCLDSCLVG
jgi:hypothetical protein